MYNKLEKISNDNPKEYCELFDQLKNCQGNINLTSQNSPIKDEEWVRHYTDLLGPKEYDSDRMKLVKDQINKIVHEPYFSELDYTTLIDEIMKAGRSLKNN